MIKQFKIRTLGKNNLGIGLPNNLAREMEGVSFIPILSGTNIILKSGTDLTLLNRQDKIDNYFKIIYG